MANDQPPVPDQTDDFLDYLLRCAMSAPGAATSPTAGRILARLLVVGAVEEGDDLITPYLVPIPGESASFEVRSYQPGDLVPTDVREGLQAAAALMIALRSARETDDGIEVVSRGDSGVERCVLVRDSTGDFEFRFASSETLVGETADCTAARAGWESVIATWRGTVPPSDDTAAWRRSPRPPVPTDPTATDPATDPVPPVAHGRGRGWWVPGRGGADEGREMATAKTGGSSDAGDEPTPAPAAPAVVAGSLTAPDLPDATGAASTEAAPTTVPVTAPKAVSTAPPEAASSTGPTTASEVAAASEAVPTPATASSTADAGTAAAAGEPLTAAIRDAIANLVVEVDLSQVEQLIRRVLEDDHREMVEPLARRLSARLGESLERNDSQPLLTGLAQVMPNPADLAEAVAADVGALLSETILRRRAADGLDSINVMAGIEQLQVRLDAVHAQLQKSGEQLRVIGDHVDAGDRRAAIAERVATSVDHEMQRLANRIDEQVTALAGSSDSSEMADSVARLTRKLRLSVTQLDRVLERMDEMLERAREPEPEPEPEPVPEDVVPFRRPLGQPLRAGEPIPPRRAGPLGPPGRR